MIIYREQKIENAIAYFASEYYRRKGYASTQMWVYKFLALLDFRILKKTGTPCLGLDYSAMERGPVPIQLYEEVNEKQAFVKGKVCFQSDVGRVYITNTEEPDLDFFSDAELSEMDALLEEIAQPGMKIDDVIKKTHKEIRSWRIAWNRAQDEHKNIMPMDYADEFHSIAEKPEEELSPEEERFLCYKGMLAKEREAAANSF